MDKKDIYEMNIIGNVVPLNWYHLIVRENGKPDMYAIAVMAELLYWHRPVLKNGIISNKFYGDAFWIDYGKMSETLNLTKKDIQRALRSLEEMKLITRQMKRELIDGELRSRMFVKINFQNLDCG